MSFGQSISSLSPSTTYYYCAIVSNSYGYGYGSVMSFTTPAMAATVTTYNATNLTKTTGTLVGYGNPGGDATSGWFRFSATSPGTCNDTFGTRAPAMGGSALGSGSSSVSFQQNITGLTAGTTYYYCALASNTMGTVLGSVQTFVTPAAPTALTAVATYVTTSSAQLNGSGNPNRAATNGWFRYSSTAPMACDDKFGSRAPVMGTTYLGTDPADTPFSQSISGLSSGTTYYYCAIVQSPEGTAFGAVLSFVTSGSPTATTAAATSVTSGSATLNGSGNPNLANATGWFRYATTNPGSCSDAFGTRAPYSGGSGLGAGSASVSFGQSISSLAPGATYYYCAIVSNSYGTGFGSVMSFTTPATAPQVTTYNATNLTRTTGTLVGYGTPGGDATTGWFRYGTASPGTCNDTFGTRAPAMSGSALGSGTSSVSFQQNITGLTPNTTYYYCALASNSMGMVLGSVQTFITPAAPTATTTVATYVTTSTAQLNGSGNPNRASANGWFRYSTTDPGTCDDKFGSRAPVMGTTYLGADPSDTPFSQGINGLSSGTTYYYCAIVQSSEGVAFGAVLSFVTSGSPTATTAAATSVTSSSATLNGSGNPNLASATGWFRYSTTNPGSCSDGFGTRAPYSSGSGLGAGSASVNFSQSISSLSPGQTYYYCAIVSNSYGTGFGSVMSFTTPATGPQITTYNATSLTRTTGTLVGYGTPGGDATTGWFRYATSSPGTCNDTFGTRAPAMGGSALGAGASSVSFQQNITGLTPGVIYYYCAIGSNSVGTAWGTVQTFITPSAPTAVTTTATYITNNTAQLNGSGNPNRGATTGWFRYALTKPMACDDTFGSRAPLMSGQYLGSEPGDVPYSASINGLSPATTYYYCAIVSSSEGTAFGAIQTFVTSGGASATTAAATSVTSGSAVLNGSGNPSGASASGWFRYASTNPGACTDGFGTRAPYSSGSSLGAGMADVSYSQSISGLLPGVTYYYCAIVSNTYGTGYGSVLSFTTPVMAPQVSTNSATNLTKTTGTLTGYANPGGDATTGWFRYSAASPGTCNDTFGTRAPAMGGTALGTGSSTVNFSQNITGLTAATTYYFCAIASNSQGTAWGAVQSFTTPTAPTALTSPATYITNSSAQLNGSGNPNRGSTTGWFRYALTNPMTCDDKFGSRAPVTGGQYLGTDITDQPYTVSITGLSSGTTYYYCAIVSSSEGTAFGTIQTFVTSGAATATSAAATSVTATTATLNGSGNPNGATATGWFRFSSTNPGTCNDTFGTRAPYSSGTGLGAGMASVQFGQPITGLAPGVTYYYCAIASNTYGTGFGSVLSFTTPASPPTVSTDYTSGIAITLNGSANPNGAATTGWFRIATTSPGTCNDTFGSRLPTMMGTSLGSGASFVSFSNATTGLTPGTTYYYCAIASNVLGTSFGVVRSFTAPMPPTVSTLAATPVTSTTATLNGSSNPNGNSTIGWFRYSTSSPGACNDVFGTRAPIASGTALGAGTAATPFGEAITGLAPATTYYFCAIASSAYGTVLGSVLSFTTPPSSSATDPTKPGSETGTAADSVLTEDATAVDAASAKLHGSTNPRGRTSTGWFRYDTTEPGACDDKFGTRAPDAEGVKLETASKSVDYAQELAGLAAATKYYYCAIASLDGKTVFGKVLSFTTKTASPSVTTAQPTEVSADSAVLNGSVLPNGDATTAWFRYSAQKPESCTDSFGERAPVEKGQDVGTGIKKVTYSVALSGLTKGATYYYCAIATNPLGTTYGEIVSFVPGTEPPAASTETPPVLDPTGTETPSIFEHTGIATTASIKSRTLAVVPPAAEATTPAPAATEAAKDADASGLGGCSYSASVGGAVGGAGSSPMVPLASILPLAGLLLLRRRRQLKAA